MQTSETAGRLYIVATPIGNLKDITLRALEVLESVDWIAAEDTRHSKKLLQHYGIHKPLISLHDHNEHEKRTVLLAQLKKGEQGALISDAGTPLISDPGYHLVSLLRQASIAVEPVPGASAMIAALSAAGIATNRFTFEGFLPAKPQKRLQQLQTLAAEPRTMVFYESPHRLMDTLQAMMTVFGAERQAVVAKELTKQFEAFVPGCLEEVIAYFSTHSDKVRGEFVLMLAGAEPANEDQDAMAIEKLVEVCLASGVSVKQTSEMVADYFGVKKKPVYQMALARKR